MKINQYLQYAIIAGLFLTLFVPFIIATHSFFPFITGKNFAFRFLTEFVFGLWLILALRDPAFRPKFSWLGAGIFVFLVIIGIADLLSANPFKSFWSNFERMEGYITLLHLFAYFLVASSVLNTEKKWTWFFQTSVGASVIMAIYGMLQLAGKIVINQGGVRLDGTLGNATYLAAFMLINFFITLFLLVRSRRVVAWRWIYGATMLLQLFILYHTATRGAILGWLGGLFIVALLLSLLSHHAVHRRVGIIVITAVLAVVVLGSLLKDTSFVTSRPSLVRLTSITFGEAGSRFMVWKMALHGFADSPKTVLVGWGQESFNYVFNKYYDPNMYAQEQWFDRTHNVIFDWLIAGGILGLLAYLSILVFALYYTWKQAELDFSFKHWFSRWLKLSKGHEIPHLLEKSVLTGLLAAYLFQNLFVFDNITSYILFFAVLAYLHSISGWSIRKFERAPASLSLQNRIITPLIIVLVVFVAYACNVPALRASTTLINALQSQPEGPSKNLQYFQKTLGLHTFGDPEIREQLTQSALQIIYTQSVDLTLKQQYYDLARSELLKQIEKTPDDARYQLFLGSFLNRSHNYDEAIKYLTRALELSPTKQTIMFELGSAYLNKGDAASALKIMKQAYDLAPDFNEARIIYAVALIYAKDFDTAQKVMEPLAGTTQEYDSRLVSAYSAAGKTSIAIHLLETQVNHDPLDPQARFALAGAYLNSGARQKAIAILQTVVKDFPGQKDQANYYIQEIQAGRNP